MPIAASSTLRPPVARADVDEFRLEVEDAASDVPLGADAIEDQVGGDEGDAPDDRTEGAVPGMRMTGRRLVTSIGGENTNAVRLSARTWEVCHCPRPGCRSRSPSRMWKSGLRCRRCEEREAEGGDPLFRPLRLGAPFLLIHGYPGDARAHAAAKRSTGVSFGGDGSSPSATPARGRRVWRSGSSRNRSATTSAANCCTALRPRGRGGHVGGRQSAHPGRGGCLDERCIRFCRNSRPFWPRSRNICDRRTNRRGTGGAALLAEAKSLLADSGDIGRMRAEYLRLSGMDIPATDYAEFCLSASSSGDRSG